MGSLHPHTDVYSLCNWRLLYEFDYWVLFIKYVMSPQSMLDTANSNTGVSGLICLLKNHKGPKVLLFLYGVYYHWYSLYSNLKLKHLKNN